MVEYSPLPDYLQEEEEEETPKYRPLKEERQPIPEENIMRDDNVNTGDAIDTSGLVYQDTTPDTSINDQDLINDPKFIEASNIIFEMNNGRAFDPATDGYDNVGEYGINMMGWFNYNLPKMSFDAARIRKKSGMEQAAFLYLMNSYDDLGLSLAGTGRFFKGVLSDPTTYVGLSTLGIGFGVRQGAGKATKEVIKGGLKGGTIGAIEGGIYTAADSVNRQVVEGEVTLSRTLSDAKYGVIGGAILGGTITGASRLIKKKPKAKDKSKEAEDEVAPKIEDDETIKPGTKASTIKGSLEEVVELIKKTTIDEPVAIDKLKDKRNIDALKNITAPIAKLLREVETKEPDEIADYLAKVEFTPSQMRVLKNTSQDAASKIKIAHKDLIEKEQATKSLKKKAEFRKAKEDLDQVVDDLDNLDLALGKTTARELEARRYGGINKGPIRGITVTKLMEQGLSRSEAEAQYLKLINEAEAKFKFDLKIKDIDDKIKKLRAQNKPESASDIQILKKEKDILQDQQAQISMGALGSFYNSFNRRLVRPLSEFLIGSVFGPATVMINMVPSVVKTLYKPFLNSLVKGGPFNTAAFRGMIAEYHAMAGMTPAAIKSAMFSFRYEQGILTGNYNRLFETNQDHAIPKKFGGGIVRFFPRLLLATDSFFEQVHYRGYIVGKQTTSAIEKAHNKGLKGKEFDDFVKDEVDTAVGKAYDSEVNVMDNLITAGTENGLSGEKLNIWVRKQITQNKDILKRAKDSGGKDYVQDLLFKRGFGSGYHESEQGTFSKLAGGYEHFVSRNPLMRLTGQLFFRTPIRVFEEGIRMTPGLNFISPRFIGDLAGRNGKARQVRAQGEALMSYAIAGSVFMLYAQGNITGAGPQNYKQRRQMEAAGYVEPYMITMKDGSTFNYRNFDPFSTPIKIIVNAMERAEVLMYRVEQGENLNKSEMDKIQGWISLGVGSIAQSIKDANLTAGVKEIMDISEDLQDPDSSGEFVKYFGRKLQTFVPSTYYKSKLQNNPELADPKTMEQFLRQRINPSDPLVPKRYSGIGIPQSLANPMSKLWIFDTTTKDERLRGMTETELRAERYLFALSQATDSHFTAPYKHELFGGIDLRSVNTADGSQSLYDRWMEIIRNNTELPLQIASMDAYPLGNPTASMGKEKVQEAISEARNIAAKILFSENEEFIEPYTGQIIRKEKSRGGLYDVLDPFTTNQ